MESGDLMWILQIPKFLRRYLGDPSGYLKTCNTPEDLSTSGETHHGPSGCLKNLQDPAESWGCRKGVGP
eukprot:2379544-Pyramimonas_sp.AAC.1